MDNQLVFDGQSLFTVNNIDPEAFASSLKESNLANTAAQEDHAMQEERFYQMEDVNSEDSFAISFEKAFMTEHSTVLAWELKNYLQAVQNYLEVTDKKILEMFPKGLYKTNPETACLEMISVLQTQITPQFKNKLMNDLKTYNKLQQFLDIVTKSCPLEMALELVKISEQVLEDYEAYATDSTGLTDLYVLMNLAFEKSKKLENIHLLDLSFLASPSSSYRKLMLRFQKFVEIYCVTTILVIAQYFQNPYFEKSMIQIPKRQFKEFQLDDDVQMEEEIDLKPHKRRKGSK